MLHNPGTVTELVIANVIVAASATSSLRGAKRRSNQSKKQPSPKKIAASAFGLLAMTSTSTMLRTSALPEVRAIAGQEFFLFGCVAPIQ
jgi:hypothetical protein